MEETEDGADGMSLNSAVNAAKPEERGTTVADAKNLAQKAARVFVHVRSDREGFAWRTTCIHLAPSVFIESLRGAADDDGMPSKLYQAGCGELWLQIG
jgi:hypothetical protein